MRRMLRVGLTGNIGSGKSTCALMLEKLGAHIIDADCIARELLIPGTATYEKVVKSFGNSILLPDGTINRRKLGQVVFSIPERRDVLNGLIHPEVRAEVKRRIEALEKTGTDGIVVVDAALMVETGFYKFFDRMIVTVCDADLQLARVVKRDKLSVEEVRARMASQMPAAEKAKVADYRIDTSGSLEQVRQRVAAVYRDLLRQEEL